MIKRRSGIDSDVSHTPSTGKPVVTKQKTGSGAEEAATLAQQLDQAQSDLRALCESEGLLSIYEELYEHFLGEDSETTFRLNDWLRETEFRHQYFKGYSLAHYQISLVMAHIVGAHDTLRNGLNSRAQKSLKEANCLTKELFSLLPEIYLDALVEEPSAPRRGGNVNNLVKKCSAILDCLRVVHDRDVVDFKSSSEAISYAIDMMINNNEIKDSKEREKLKRFFPFIFRRWLSGGHEEAELFKVYTGFSVGE